MNTKTAKKNEARDLERLAEAVGRWERRGEKWAAEGDTEMGRAHAKDAKDLRALAAAVKRGDYRRAETIARRLDTVVRDLIPVRLYNAVVREN